MENHSANQVLKAATNLNVVQPKLFQGSRQDDLRFSDCTVSVIQILDDGDAAFRILGAGLRTVLSVTTMFADKPHRLNGRMRATILCFDDLASGYRTRGWATRAAGYRAAISCFAHFGRSVRPPQRLLMLLKRNYVGTVTLGSKMRFIELPRLKQSSVCPHRVVAHEPGSGPYF